MSNIRIILFFIFCNSCDIGKEINFSDPSPELAFPLGHAVFEPASFLLNLKLPATFTTDANGFIHFSYATVLQEVNALQFTGEIDALFPSLIPINKNDLLVFHMLIFSNHTLFESILSNSQYFNKTSSLINNIPSVL